MKAPKVKLSYAYSRGSVAQRRQKVQQLNRQLFEQVSAICENQNLVRISDLRKKLREIIPQPIYWSMRKLNESEENESSGQLEQLIQDNQLFRYVLKLPANHNQLEKKNIYIFIHEATHLFDMLLNPKYIKTVEKYSNAKTDKDMNMLYKRYYYKREKYGIFCPQLIMAKIRFQTMRILKKHGFDEQITILKFINTELQQEKLAYQEEYKCKQKMLQKFDDFNDDEDYGEMYLFDRKINLVKSILFELIKKERKKTAKNH